MTDQPPVDVNAAAQTAIANREENKVKETITLTGMVEEHASKLLNSERGKQFAASLTLMGQQNPKLQRCTTTSIMTAMMSCVNLDLMPNTPEGYAYIIPYKDTAQFIIGYQGLIELCYRTGLVISVNAEPVFPEDTFDYTLGTLRSITHVPNMQRDRTKFDEMTHVYATATLVNGSTVFDVMGIDEIKQIRSIVKAKSDDAPWKAWPIPMSKKTVIKRMTKYLPKSRVDNRLFDAVRWDDLSSVGKLILKDGVPIEGTPPAPQSPQTQEKKLKIFAKPVEFGQTEEEPVVDTTENQDQPNELPDQQIDESQQPPDENTTVEKAPEPPEESSPDVSADDLRDDIEDMLEFLKINKREEMRIINEYANTPLLKNADVESLKKIYEHLKEIADAKTELQAQKEEDK